MGLQLKQILKPKYLFAAALLSALPAVSQAVAITYNIQNGSAPNFSGSWIHSADTQMGTSGYFANGTKTEVAGTLTIDTANLAATSGQLTANGDFGSGSAMWTIDFNGASSGSHTFIGGDVDLISIDYSLNSFGLMGGEVSSTGTFYFADRDFNGAPISNGPNYFDDSVLYLWGNNWVNLNGASDKPTTYTPLGLDLYGVPEPSVALLLGIGLLGLASKRLLKSA